MAPAVKHPLTASPLSVTPELGQPTLTVGQIVKQLGSLAPNAEALSERIRHWTREGLLLPVDQHHAGTGRHRRYDANAGYDVAILNALATAGLQLVSRPYIRIALGQARKALQKWRRASDADRDLPLSLVITHFMQHKGDEPTTKIREGIGKPDPTAELEIVVNLSRLFMNIASCARSEAAS